MSFGFTKFSQVRKFLHEYATDILRNGIDETNLVGFEYVLEQSKEVMLENQLRGLTHCKG